MLPPWHFTQAAWTEGLQSTGVAACAKHFPGHGDTSQDSHVALPVVDADEATLRERELVPFRAAIAAGTRTIMTSHIVVPALDPEHPATFSTRILTGLLREELGFDGVIVTDALDMAGASGGRGIPAAAVAALAAGADLLCIGTRNTDAQIGDDRGSHHRSGRRRDPARRAAGRRDRSCRVARNELGDGTLHARRIRRCPRSGRRRRAKGLPRVCQGGAPHRQAPTPSPSWRSNPQSTWRWGMPPWGPFAAGVVGGR